MAPSIADIGCGRRAFHAVGGVVVSTGKAEEVVAGGTCEVSAYGGHSGPLTKEHQLIDVAGFIGTVEEGIKFHGIGRNLAIDVAAGGIECGVCTAGAARIF